MTAAEHTARLAEAQRAHDAAYRHTIDSRRVRETAVAEAIDAGWTQRQVAEAMGVSYQLVSRIALRR